MKLIVSFLLSINILIADQMNIVKTSELELFLFKVGFESLLKDVDITKNKSDLNEKELKKLNSKIEIIMDEIYKEKRVLTNNSKDIDFKYSTDKNIKKEISILKNEIEFLKNQLNKLLSNNKSTLNKEVKKVNLDEMQYVINANIAKIRQEAFPRAEVIGILKKGTLVSIDYCNKYGWCKLKGEKKFVPKFVLKK